MWQQCSNCTRKGEGPVAPTQKFVWLRSLDVGGQITFIWRRPSCGTRAVTGQLKKWGLYPWYPINTSTVCLR